MWNQMMWSIELLYLAACTKSDVRSGWISVPLSAVCLGAGVLWRCIGQGFLGGHKEVIWACLVPGFIAGMVAWLSRGGFGMGDAWMIAVSAWLLEIMDFMMLVLYAFVVAGVCGVVLLVSKKKGRKDSFAFAPCMLAAYVIGLIRGSFL